MKPLQILFFVVICLGTFAQSYSATKEYHVSVKGNDTNGSVAKPLKTIQAAANEKVEIKGSEIITGWKELDNDTWVKEQTQFPIKSVFNHEPKKTETGESAEQFSEYLWMNLSRGTGFVELYLKTSKLSECDWDGLASKLFVYPEPGIWHNPL